MGMLEDIQVFLCVLQQQSFSAAARELNLTPSTVSKTISRLESRLNTSLFERIGGQIKSTQEAHILKREGVKALVAMRQAEEMLSQRKENIAGRVRIHTALTTAKYLLAPLLPQLLNQYPLLELDFVLDTQRSNFLEDDIDIAIHSGRPIELSLIGRPIMKRPWVIAASPDYLKQYGIPKTPSDLANHRCLNFSIRTQWNSWLFKEKDLITAWEQGNFISANQGEFLHTLALHGLGIIRLAHFHIKNDLETGHLLPLLEQHMENSQDDQFYLLYPKRRQTARAKVVIDYLYQHLK